MPRESYRERALVIRTYDLGEADRIIVFLTQHRGLVRGVAKGVRRARSRFGSRLQPFVELDVQFYVGRELESVTAADTVGFYGSGIIDNITCYTAASAVLEAAERLSLAHDEHDDRLYPLVVDTLKQLQHAPEPKLRLDTFLLQAMTGAGTASRVSPADGRCRVWDVSAAESRRREPGSIARHVAAATRPVGGSHHAHHRPGAGGFRAGLVGIGDA